MSAVFTHGERLPPLRCAPVSLEQVLAYVAASGDDNPIHADEASAIAAGLECIVLPGMLIAAQFPRLLRHWPVPHGLVALDVRFLSPLAINRPFGVEGRVVSVDQAGTRAIVRMSARDERAVFAMGEATCTRL